MHYYYHIHSCTIIMRYAHSQYWYNQMHCINIDPPLTLLSGCHLPTATPTIHNPTNHPHTQQQQQYQHTDRVGYSIPTTSTSITTTHYQTTTHYLRVDIVAHWHWVAEILVCEQAASRWEHIGRYCVRPWLCVVEAGWTHYWGLAHQLPSVFPLSPPHPTWPCHPCLISACSPSAHPWLWQLHHQRGTYFCVGYQRAPAFIRQSLMWCHLGGHCFQNNHHTNIHTSTLQPSSI